MAAPRLGGGKRLSARVRGQVQGVGYRFFAIRTARLLHVGGYARNLPDGTVEVVAEGDPEVLSGLLAELRRGPAAASVDRVDCAWSDATGEFRGFDVRY